MKNTQHTKRSGQIIVIALILLGSLSLVVVSVVTQMVLEQRKAALEEKTQKAFYSAESGIEEALKQLQSSSSASVEDFNLSGAAVSVTTSTGKTGNIFDIGLELNSGEPFYVNLTGYNIATPLRICWDKTASFAILYNYTSGTRKTTTFGLNSSGSTSSISGTGVVVVAPGASCGLSTGFNYDLNLNPLGGVPDYLTIWPLYQNKVHVSFQAVGLPDQGTVITSTAQVGELDSQVTRSIRYFQSDRTYASPLLLFPFYGGSSVSYATQ